LRVCWGNDVSGSYLVIVSIGYILGIDIL